MVLVIRIRRRFERILVSDKREEQNNNVDHSLTNINNDTNNVTGINRSSTSSCYYLFTNSTVPTYPTVKRITSSIMGSTRTAGRFGYFVLIVIIVVSYTSTVNSTNDYLLCYAYTVTTVVGLYQQKQIHHQQQRSSLRRHVLLLLSTKSSSDAISLFTTTTTNSGMITMKDGDDAKEETIRQRQNYNFVDDINDKSSYYKQTKSPNNNINSYNNISNNKDTELDTQKVEEELATSTTQSIMLLDTDIHCIGTSTTRTTMNEYDNSVDTTVSSMSQLKQLEKTQQFSSAVVSTSSSLRSKQPYSSSLNYQRSLFINNPYNNPLNGKLYTYHSSVTENNHNIPTNTTTDHQQYQQFSSSTSTSASLRSSNPYSSSLKFQRALFINSPYTNPYNGRYNNNNNNNYKNTNSNIKNNNETITSIQKKTNYIDNDFTTMTLSSTTKTIPTLVSENKLSLSSLTSTSTSLRTSNPYSYSIAFQRALFINKPYSNPFNVNSDNTSTSSSSSSSTTTFYLQPHSLSTSVSLRTANPYSSVLQSERTSFIDNTPSSRYSNNDRNSSRIASSSPSTDRFHHDHHHHHHHHDNKNDNNNLIQRMNEQRQQLLSVQEQQQQQKKIRQRKLFNKALLVSPLSSSLPIQLSLQRSSSSSSTKSNITNIIKKNG